MPLAKCLAATAVGLAVSLPVFATPFLFSTGNPDGRMGTASRPSAPGKTEVETADDFITTASTTLINKASFTGLLTGGASIASLGSIGIEIYRVFPKDSTSPPSGSVPTRVNSPSDVAFDSRLGGSLSFSCSTLSSSFTVSNSVIAGGIHPLPNQTTGGNGPVSGAEIRCDISFLTPLALAADHYYFVPLVDVGGGDFLWLSAPKPIVAPGDPFSPDLQTWIRDESLDPDWLRVGTDIVGGSPAPTFNAAFTLAGETGAVPEPGMAMLLGAGLLGLFAARRRR